MAKRSAIIIGAGPAGLTAAHELLTRTEIHPIVLEMSEAMGGISQTVVHNGNRIDIGGHRFFSKSDRVMNWWLDHLPMESTADEQITITYQNRSRVLNNMASSTVESDRDAVMLLRDRKSRIYYQGKFFNYPISLDLDTIRKLGVRRTGRIGVSYVRASLQPRPEQSLEDFLINRFGRELYQTFFRDYTEKVWGTPCHDISAEWGAQRIKGLSLRSAAAHFFKQLLPSPPEGIAQKQTETSLIERFLYPKYGPGQMWEHVADKVRAAGGEIHTGWKVTQLHTDPDNPQQLTGVTATNRQGEQRRWDADLVFSTMPIKDLVRGMRQETAISDEIVSISEGLIYRDFITVGLLLERLEVSEDRDGQQHPISDNWLYIQDADVDVGRIQVFNNWSPHLVQDPSKTWIGLEYFCNEGDRLWSLSDADMAALAVSELVKIGLARSEAVVDQVVIRMPKTYPAYFGSYERFDELRAWLDGFENLYPMGRNGMHRYNNQDHSMLTAMVTVDNLVAGRTDRTNIWEVNTEQEYHETRKSEG